MTLLVLKLTLTPVLIAAASLSARRWGPAVGGWLVALPLTSGPIALYLALEQGPAFAASLAAGSLGGLLGDALFALAYARVVRRAPGAPWPVSLGAGCLGFFVGAVAVQPLLAAPTPLLLLVVVAGMAVSAGLVRVPAALGEHVATPNWDIPARIVVGTALVLAISEVAEVLGPHTSGIIATFPVYVSVLTVFAHRLEGPEQAVGILRGLQFGLFGTAVFMAALSVVLEPLGTAAAFVVAIALSLLVHAAVVTLRRRSVRRHATRRFRSGWQGHFPDT